MAGIRFRDPEVWNGPSVPLIWLLIAWLLGNFVFIALVSWLAGGWYLGWSSQVASILAELGLIQIPNLVIPLVLLRIANIRDVRIGWASLGWRWGGWRPILVGIIAFIAYLGINMLVTLSIGSPIPYQLPGRQAVVSAQGLISALGLLLLLLAYLGLTTFGEETMFRGLIQTNFTRDYGAIDGILVAALLFGLRHLPADLYYGQA